MRLLKILRLALLIAVLSMDIYLSVKVDSRPLQGIVSEHRTQTTSGQFMKINFGPLPDRMTVRVLLVPQSEQRYDTLGDWVWTGTRIGNPA